MAYNIYKLHNLFSVGELAIVFRRECIKCDCLMIPYAPETFYSVFGTIAVPVELSCVHRGIY